MAQKSDKKKRNPQADRLIVIGSAVMIVLYLAFGHAFAAPHVLPHSMVMDLPAYDGPAPTGAPTVLASEYKAVN